jgi:hypothetical protein
MREHRQAGWIQIDLVVAVGAGAPSAIAFRQPAHRLVTVRWEAVTARTRAGDAPVMHQRVEKPRFAGLFFSRPISRILAV